MIRNDVSEELKYSATQINGIVLTGYTYPGSPSWVWASLDPKDGILTTSYITPLLKVKNTCYTADYYPRPKFIPFPKNMNLLQFRDYYQDGLNIYKFILDHTGQVINGL